MKKNDNLKKHVLLEYFSSYREAAKYFEISPSAISQWDIIPMRRVYELYNLKKIKNFISKTTSRKITNNKRKNNYDLP